VSKNVARYYKRLLRGGAALAGESGAFEGLESTISAASAEADLSDSAIKDRLESTRDELHRIVETYLGGKKELYEIADKIASDGKTALRAVSEEDEDILADSEIRASLEVIVRTDGSRPSFMVRHGEPDLQTSPVGEWKRRLSESAEKLRKAVASVGRIDDPSSGQGFQGTGILIGPATVITNRHVLQAIATETAPGDWKLKKDIVIDFGHEYDAKESSEPKVVKSVVYAAARKIEGSIDQSKLDLALLEIDPASESQRPLALDIDKDWGTPEKGVFICGYPGDPGWNAADSQSLLEQLFQLTYGCKRLAPGLVTSRANSDELKNGPNKWTLGHDATTLGGNSGSAVFVLGRETMVAGLHFGGRFRDPRENWCHIVGRALDEADTKSRRPLGDVLKDRGVILGGRTVTS
jgi:V8-like Glu-specific endopeptidase